MKNTEAILVKPGTMKIMDAPMPVPKDDEILLKVEYVGICGSDIHGFQYGPFIPPKDPNQKIGLGRECAGTVVETGKNVKNFKVGDRAVGANSVPCFHCFFCRKGLYSLCENLEYLNGAYSEYVVIPEQILKYNYLHIPEGLDYREAALVEPLACALHGIDNVDIKVGDTLAVIGAGPIGLMFVKLASLKGARVISVDLSDYRLEQAKKFGAFETVNAKDADHIDKVRKLSEEEKGVDAAIEATGFPEAWKNAVGMVRNHGQVLAFGGTKKGAEVTLDCQRIHYGEINIKAIYHHTPYHIKRALDLLATRQIDGSMFITGEYPLSGAIDALESIGRQEGIKYAIVP